MLAGLLLMAFIILSVVGAFSGSSQTPDASSEHVSFLLEALPKKRHPAGMEWCGGIAPEAKEAVAALGCEGHGAQVTVEYFDSWGGAPARLQFLAEANGLSQGYGACPYDAPIRQKIYYYDRGHKFSGEAICYIYGPFALYAWTNPTQQRITVASFHQRNLEEGQRWFEKYSGAAYEASVTN